MFIVLNFIIMEKESKFFDYFIVLTIHVYELHCECYLFQIEYFKNFFKLLLI